MGTNYYLQKVNQETGRTKDIHICKTSGGWTPSMRGYRRDLYYGDDSWHDDPKIESWRDWKWFLLKETKKGGIIFDEYDDAISLKNFFKKIKEWQDPVWRSGLPKKNHAEEALKGEFSNGVTDSHAASCWVDDDGYSFHDGEFS